MAAFFPGPMAPVPDATFAVPVDLTSALVVLTTAVVAAAVTVLIASLAATGSRWCSRTSGEDETAPAPHAA
ncbi:MAG: hypothetical protein AB1689_24590 [Thermodesulfobacteriota bacterium]